jgi:transcriptional regulator with XRE-family HTH domain
LENIKNNSFGSRVATLRKAKGFTQKQLADKIDIPWNVLSDYERGKARLNDSVIYKIAIVLQISADEILGLKKREVQQDISLRIIRRIQRIEKLNPKKKKRLLSALDDLIFAAERRKE